MSKSKKPSKKNVKKESSKLKKPKLTKEQKKSLEAAKKQIVEKLIKEKGLSKKEAEDVAKKLIAQGPPGESPISKLLLEMLDKEDAKSVENYVASVVGKFGKYIKSVVIFGSKKTKVTVTKKTHDIDIAIIVDDTDVRKMTRGELKDKLFQRLLEMGYPLSKKIHPQPYLLTEFWQYTMEGNPVIYNVLRDGVILYDTGFFLPLQMLMKMGNIKPSKESIDKHIYVSNELIKLVKNTCLNKLSYDIEQAVVSSAQAVLMELGYRPPAPSEASRFVQEILVEKEKLVPEKYAKIIHKIVKNYKDIEHKEKKEYPGSEFEEHFKITQEFVAKMQEVLKKIRDKKGESFLFETAEFKKKNEEEKKKKVERPTDIELDRGEKPDEKASELIRKELGQR